MLGGNELFVRGTADGWTEMGWVGGRGGSVEAGWLGRGIEVGELIAEVKLQATAGMTSSKQVRKNSRLIRNLAWDLQRVGITSSMGSKVDLLVTGRIMG